MSNPNIHSYHTNPVFPGYQVLRLDVGNLLKKPGRFKDYLLSRNPEDKIKGDDPRVGWLAQWLEHEIKVAQFQVRAGSIEVSGLEDNMWSTLCRPGDWVGDFLVRVKGTATIGQALHAITSTLEREATLRPEEAEANTPPSVPAPTITMATARESDYDELRGILHAIGREDLSQELSEVLSRIRQVTEAAKEFSNGIIDLEGYLNTILAFANAVRPSS